MSYQTAQSFFGQPSEANANLTAPYPSYHRIRQVPSAGKPAQRQYPHLIQSSAPKPAPPAAVVSPAKENFQTPSRQIKWVPQHHESTMDPAVWGRMFWFTLHNGARHYPQNPSHIVRERTKGFILGVPYQLPCQECFNHAVAYINERKGSLDEVVSSRRHLFAFWLDMHNYVNKRQNKPVLTYDEAWVKYGGPVTVLQPQFE